MPSLKFAALLLSLAATIALAMSTQLLAQPFVWRHWPWDEVLQAWLTLAGHRLSVALPIALMVALAMGVPVRTQRARAFVLALAIVVGATAGELALVATGGVDSTPSASAIAGHVLQWCLLSISVASLLFLWRRTSALQGEALDLELHRIQSRRQLMEARVQALRSQIEPHFLFNTLATVRRLHRTEQRQGAQLLEHFLAYLRSALPEMQEEGGTLGREIELVRAYLGVVGVRMAGRLEVIFDVPLALCDCEFPPLAAATLVENAIKHGIGPSPGGGAILVQARSSDASMEVVVADTGVGFSTAGAGGSGIGLANIRARLQTLYGGEGILRIEANPGGGVRATIRLPRRLPGTGGRP